MPAQTRASRRRAQSTRAQPSLPLLQLPGPTHQELVSHLSLPDRCSLRLVCKAAAALVDECTRALNLQLRMFAKAPHLHQRYPGVVTLVIDGSWGLGDGSGSDSTDGSDSANSSNSGSGCDGGQEQHSAPIVAPMAIQPWRKVSNLTVTDCMAHEVAVALNACPNVEACALVNMYWEGDKCPDAGSLAALRSTLASFTRLTSLDLYESFQDLDEVNMAAVSSSCPGLTALTGLLHPECHARGWAMLMQLTALKRLHLEHGDLTADLVMDFAPLHALTSLEVQQAGEEMMPEQHAAAYTSLQLPGSLQRLTVDMLPMGALAAVPQLTHLEVFEPEVVTAMELGAIASACPMLASLNIMNLELTSECHSTPLPAVTELDLTGDMTASQGASLSVVLPCLRSIILDSSAVMPSLGTRITLWKGVSTLQSIEICESSDVEPDAPYSALQPQDFAALVTLPHLTRLNIPAMPEHVLGLGVLTTVSSLTLLSSGKCALSDTAMATMVQDAFCRCAPLPLLHTVTLQYDELEQLEPQGVRAVKGVVREAVKWLARAPSLVKVLWKADVWGPAALPTSALISLSKHGIKHVTIQPLPLDHEREPPISAADVCRWYADMQPTLHAVAASGMDIVLDGWAFHSYT